MKIIRRVAMSKVEFTDEPEDLRQIINENIHAYLGVKIDGIEYSKAYKMGHIDGLKAFYNAKTGEFATGLINQVEDCVKKLQRRYSTLDLELVDEYPERWVEDDEFPSTIKLPDDKLGEIELRDYQYRSVREAVLQQMGIIHVATNGGKCVTKDTILTTDHGFMTMETFFEKQGLPMMDKEEVIPYTGNISLVNMEGELEKPSHLTYNGKREVFKVTTADGFTEESTANHPYLVASDYGNDMWVKTEDLEEGMLIATRRHTSMYGTNKISWSRARSIGKNLCNFEKYGEVLPKVLESTYESQLGFLSGYIEASIRYRRTGDKHAYFLTENPKIAQQIQLMLLNIGYRCTVQYKDGYNKVTLDTLTLRELVNDLKFFSEKGTKEAQEFIREVGVDLRVLEDYKVDVVYTKITSVKSAGVTETYDVAMPDTHSFIANGMVNHNTEIGSGIIQQLLPQLQDGERIVFVVPTKEIFYGAKERLEQRLGIEVGVMGDGKRDIKTVNVVLMPSLVASLKDPSKDVKVTAKERVPQIVVQEILPKFKGKANVKTLLKNYMRSYVPNTKAREQIKETLTELAHSELSNAQVLKAMNNYEVQYTKAMEKKAGAKWAKYQETLDFVNSVVCVICDETHRAKGDTWFDTLSKFTNAQYRIGMTGTIDYKDSMLWQKLQGLFGQVVEKVANEELIGKGFSAKPFIKLINIKEPTTISHERNYQVAYSQGIVENDHRNLVIAMMCKTVYDDGKTSLIIVNRLEHGERIYEILQKHNVEAEFINGELDSDIRKRQLEDVKSGKLRVLIATTVLDEGVDISGIHCLILGAGGKSLRQTLQRVGRILRRKEDDNRAIVIDFYDRTNKYLLNHSKERESIYLEEGFDVKFIN